MNRISLINKRFTKVLFLIMVIVLSACSKDVETINMIEGEWEYYESYSNQIKNSQPLFGNPIHLEFFDIDGKEGKFNYTFTGLQDETLVYGPKNFYAYKDGQNIVLDMENYDLDFQVFFKEDILSLISAYNGSTQRLLFKKK